jgi:hypothetical protein
VMLRWLTHTAACAMRRRCAASRSMPTMNMKSTTPICESSFSAPSEVAGRDEGLRLRPQPAEQRRAEEDAGEHLADHRRLWKRRKRPPISRAATTMTTTCSSSSGNGSLRFASSCPNSLNGPLPRPLGVHPAPGRGGVGRRRGPRPPPARRRAATQVQDAHDRRHEDADDDDVDGRLDDHDDASMGAGAYLLPRYAENSGFGRRA